MRCAGRHSPRFVRSWPHAWERPRLGSNSVIQEPDGSWKAWYATFPGSVKQPNTIGTICYAESADGVHWVKPMLGLIPWEATNETQTNIVVTGPDLYGSAVVRDDQSDDPNALYKMVTWTQNCYTCKPPKVNYPVRRHPIHDHQHA